MNVIRDGGVIVYPTDSCYALGCHIGDKHAMQRIRRIRQAGKDHNFTLVCRDLAEISTYARVENWAYRLLRSLTPGPYTFILRASHEVPRRLQNPKRRSIGLRVPAHPIPLAILEELGEVAEGVLTAKSANALAHKLGVEMPITAEIHALLYEDKPARQAMVELLSRERRAERD